METGWHPECQDIMLTTVFFHYNRKKKKEGKKEKDSSSVKKGLFKRCDCNKDQITLHISLVVTSDRLRVHIHIGTRAYCFLLSSNLSLLYCEMPRHRMV